MKTLTTILLVSLALQFSAHCEETSHAGEQPKTRAVVKATNNNLDAIIAGKLRGDTMAVVSEIENELLAGKISPEVVRSSLLSFKLNQMKADDVRALREWVTTLMGFVDTNPGESEIQKKARIYQQVLKTIFPEPASDYSSTEFQKCVDRKQAVETLIQSKMNREKAQINALDSITQDAEKAYSYAKTKDWSDDELRPFSFHTAERLKGATNSRRLIQNVRNTISSEYHAAQSAIQRFATGGVSQAEAEAQLTTTFSNVDAQLAQAEKAKKDTRELLTLAISDGGQTMMNMIGATDITQVPFSDEQYCHEHLDAIFQEEQKVVACAEFAGITQMLQDMYRSRGGAAVLRAELEKIGAHLPTDKQGYYSIFIGLYNQGLRPYTAMHDSRWKSPMMPGNIFPHLQTDSSVYPGLR